MVTWCNDIIFFKVTSTVGSFGGWKGEHRCSPRGCDGWWWCDGGDGDDDDGDGGGEEDVMVVI